MQQVIVQKFGGTSVGSGERIAAVAEIIKKEAEINNVVIVVSAMAGETDRLIELSKQFGDNQNKREFDALISTGEKVSASLLAMALNSLGLKAKSYSAAQVSLKTTSNFSKAMILDIDKTKMEEILSDDSIPIITGFQGITETGEVTTLGRGGSDTTAVAIAASIKADRCDIYTDVDGVYTTDPRLVPDARRLKKISYEEMLEMASLGSKVLQTRSVELAMAHKVKLQVRSSFDDPARKKDVSEDGIAGTMVCSEEEIMEQEIVSGIAYSKDEAKITLRRVADHPGTAAAIFGPLADAAINVDMIVQNISADGGYTDMTFTVPNDDLSRAHQLIESMRENIGFSEVESTSGLAKISIVGVGMRSHAGVAQKMFMELADKSINIQVISTSEIKISVLVDADYTELGVRALHAAFNLDGGNEVAG